MLDAEAHLASRSSPLLQVSNTICQTEHIKQANGKLEIMDISPVLAESIRRVSSLCRSRFAPFDGLLTFARSHFHQTHNGESISLLFSEGGASMFS